MNKSLKRFLLFGVMGIFGGVAIQAEGANASTLLRVYNPNSGEHHYTLSSGERDGLVKVGWKNEGNAWEVPDQGTPVYRLYNPNAGDHHYTLDNSEKSYLENAGWKYEGVSWQSGGSTPVYRLYNPNAKAGSHHYTLSSRERDGLVNAGWKSEGTGFYSTQAAPIETVEPRKVDIGATGLGGTGTGPADAYRLLYSNRAFDTASLTGTPTIDFSADVALTGNSNDYEYQFVVAGNGDACGQIGVSLHFQAGTDVDFAQGRINVTNINFPANSGIYGQQYYSVNTNAPRIANGQSVKLQVKYFASQGYMQTFVNGTLVGQYKTTLTPGGNAYILHDTTNAPVKVRNLKVLRDGVDVTTGGAPKFPSTNYDRSSGSVAGAY